MAVRGHHDVIIIGAGAAGLACLRELSKAGADVLCLEARDRIGGRILTIHDPLAPVPIELGPEFVHGRPLETWQLITDHRLTVVDCEENAVHIRDGKPLEKSKSWDQIESVTEDMKALEERGKDMPFDKFLAQRSYDPVVKQMATNFVEGFNAARKEVVGIASLAQDARAAEKIEGDTNFRIVNGYSRIAELLANGHERAIRLNQIVEHVEWKCGTVSVSTKSGLTGDISEWRSKAIVVTVPLGVLQQGGIKFSPEPQAALQAAKGLAFGDVNRVVMRFHEPWWEQHERFKDAGFWLSTEAVFPTWWTLLPLRTPLLVGWSAGSHADRLAEADSNSVIQAAVDDLSAVTALDRATIKEQLAAAHFHDWRKDPFARGAYSYVPAGALPHRTTLATPLKDTLFFSGEATELEGHSATVHGAIATGRRSARQLLALQG